jgi:hypothetical protein
MPDKYLLLLARSAETHKKADADASVTASTLPTQATHNERNTYLSIQQNDRNDLSLPLQQPKLLPRVSDFSSYAPIPNPLEPDTSHPTTSLPAAANYDCSSYERAKMLLMASKKVLATAPTGKDAGANGGNLTTEATCSLAVSFHANGTWKDGNNWSMHSPSSLPNSNSIATNSNEGGTAPAVTPHYASEVASIAQTISPLPSPEPCPKSLTMSWSKPTTNIDHEDMSMEAPGWKAPDRVSTDDRLAPASDDVMERSTAAVEEGSCNEKASTVVVPTMPVTPPKMSHNGPPYMAWSPTFQKVEASLKDMRTDMSSNINRFYYDNGPDDYLDSWLDGHPFYPIDNEDACWLNGSDSDDEVDMVLFDWSFSN